MNIAERYVADRLRGDGHHIYRTDAPSAGDLSVMEHALLKRGYTVLPPGALPAVSLDRAKQVCEAHDYTVLAPEVPPAIGAWVPEHADAYPTRFVSGLVGDTVTYGCMGVTHTCKVKTFHIWRRQRHAKLHDMQATVQEPMP